MEPYIAKAGTYDVQQIHCPHFMTPVDLSLPRAGVLHTTQGGWAGAAGIFAHHWASHFMVGLNVQGKAEIAQLAPIGLIAAALVANNDLALIQIEVIGFSKATPYIFDDETLGALAALMRVCRDEYGIPLTRPWADGDFGIYGDNPHRHSGKFGKVAGWFSHGDVPLPDTHWDCGNLEWAKIFAEAS